MPESELQRPVVGSKRAIEHSFSQVVEPSVGLAVSRLEESAAQHGREAE
jgi:hypothetical protein